MNRLLATLLCGLFLQMAATPSIGASKKTAGRDAYTKEQQKKIFAESLKVCRKKYGDHLHHVQVDYARKRYMCWAY